MEAFEGELPKAVIESRTVQTPFGFGCGDRGSHTGSHRHHRVQNSHLISHIAARPFAQPFAIIRIPPQAGGKLQSSDYPPCFLRSLARIRTHRRIDAKLRKSTCSDVCQSGLGFSNLVHHPDARVLPDPKHKRFRVGKSSMFSSLPLLRRASVDLPPSSHS